MAQDGISRARARLNEGKTEMADSSAGFMTALLTPRLWGKSKSDSLTSASEAYLAAGQAFKGQPGHNKEAGDAYKMAAEIQMNKLDDPLGSASSLKEAFTAYSPVDMDAASWCADTAYTRFCLLGELNRAARIKRDEGEMFAAAANAMPRMGNTMSEQARILRQSAQKCFETSAKSYDADTNAKALASAEWGKAGDLAGLLGDDDKAIEAFDRVAQFSITRNGPGYSNRLVFLKAGICHLATNDMIAVDRALDRFCQMDPGFERELEFSLLVNLRQAVQNQNKKEFDQVLEEYTKRKRVDAWQRDVLARVRDMIQGGGPEEEVGEFD